MALSDDLRAAKALIDTPEKWDGYGRDVQTVLNAITLSGHSRHLRFLMLHDAMGDVTPKLFRRSYNNYGRHHRTTHADVMDLFDRAISAATLTEQSNDQ